MIDDEKLKMFNNLQLLMRIKGFKLLDFDKMFKIQPLPRQYRFSI